MQLLRTEEDVVGCRFGAACYLATSQWETPPAEAPEPPGSWRPDAVGPVDIRWQAARPPVKGPEFAYPLMLAALRAVVRKVRRLPPFVAIVDLSTAQEAYVEVARIGDGGIERLGALRSRSAGSLARAVELLSTDDGEPVYYLGNRRFPEGEDSKLGALVIPLAGHPVTLAALLEAGTNRKRTLPLVLLSARQQTLALALVGIGLWGWSAGQWWQIRQALATYGPGLLQPELTPLKEQLKASKTRHSGLESEFSRARSGHIPSTRLAGLLRRHVGEGAYLQKVILTERRKLQLTVVGSPIAVLQSLGKFEHLGKLGDLHFGVRTRDQVSIPIEIDLANHLQTQQRPKGS
ncbi:hypothetical protein [Gloeobacter violaceus]|uniref:Gll3881 protein n=1 Tax=Gloeobacter violaceus (strain ATCC 29082 / PCC 7421) TaxID=251221 RepID=Q7NEJ8_GLOVI|nr:hypothetical protein [Gloeobacter violaceus]BAC91822.1 gll3881 [Gloeobacter violaceus PCC 7421]